MYKGLSFSLETCVEISVLSFTVKDPWPRENWSEMDGPVTPVALETDVSYTLNHLLLNLKIQFF